MNGQLGQNAGLYRFGQGELGPVQASSTVLPGDYCVQVIFTCFLEIE